MIVDTRKNGEVLPELPGEKIMVRYNNSTILLPRKSKVKNKEQYIINYKKLIERDQKRHG